MPELLAPVSSMEMAQAAVHSGADAVYVGAPGFNARSRQKDPDYSLIKEIIQYNRLYGLKTYIAFNVLIYQNELPAAEETLLRLAEFSPDAFIIQDPAVAFLIKKNNLKTLIHASTQLAVASADAAEFYRDLGFSRITLARELSLREIEKIRCKTDLELEVFVHGALCISFSGLCNASAGLSGFSSQVPRSANKGECAQACRMQYDLIADGKTIRQNEYIMSASDLSALDFAHHLADAGVDSLKIEGRSKDAAYTAAAVRLWRNELDGISRIRCEERGASGRNPDAVKHESERKILYYKTHLTFSRGFQNHWLSGRKRRLLINPSVKSHTGIKIGVTHKINPPYAHIKLLYPEDDFLRIAAGDGLLFRDGHGAETGGSVFSVKIEEDTALVRMNNDFPYGRIVKGMEVYLTGRPSLLSELKKIRTDKVKMKRIPLKLTVSALTGSPLYARYEDPDGNASEGKGDTLITAARNSTSSGEMILEELKALSGSVYKVTECVSEISEGIFISNREVKRLRQRLISRLDEMRINAGSPVRVHPDNFPDHFS